MSCNLHDEVNKLFNATFVVRSQIMRRDYVPFFASREWRRNLFIRRVKYTAAYLVVTLSAFLGMFTLMVGIFFTATGGLYDGWVFLAIALGCVTLIAGLYKTSATVRRIWRSEV